MSQQLRELFSDKKIIQRIQNKMPNLFQLAEIDNSRNGKLGMEIGSARERIIIALLIYKFGEENVDAKNSITDAEVDVKLFGHPISIKTITDSLAGVKLIWTVDEQKALEFAKNYKPTYDILLTNIKWGKSGCFYYIPQSSQLKVFKKLRKEQYFKLPKAGTNPRGVEITEEALKLIVKDKDVMSIDINWIRSEMNYDAYDRWVELWHQD